MRIHSLEYIILIISLVSCKNDYSTCDLPSPEIMETLIYESIIQSTINVYKLNSHQLDSLKRNEIPIMQYKLNRNINIYSLENKGEKLIHDRYEFSNNYLLSSRFIINNETLFTPSDTDYISYQIKNSRHFKIDDLLIKNAQLIDSNDIKKAEFMQSTAEIQNLPFRFDYIEINTPLLNKQKDIAIIGISGYHLSESLKTGFGNYIIMKKRNGKWIRLDEVMWWSN